MKRILFVLAIAVLISGCGKGPQGTPGANGDTGSAGPSGTNGNGGKDGASIAYSVSPITSPCQGHLLSLWIDVDGDGNYDPNVDRNFSQIPICNGVPPSHGPNT